MNSPEMDWGNAEIVDKEQEYYKRCFLELYNDTKGYNEYGSWDFATSVYKCVITR